MNDTQLSPTLVKEAKSLFDMGAHLGHKKNRLHPKARKYVYKIMNGVSIIDLSMTVTMLDKAKKQLKELAKEEKVLLVVATKKIISQFTAETCEKNKVAYITSKWLPGLLTNFDTIIKNVKSMNDLRTEKESGAWDKYVKHERISLDKKLSKLEKFYKGLTNITKKPDALLIVDIKKEKNAVKEGTTHQLPLICVVDTNSNPELVDTPIIVNDDSPSVMQHVITDLVEAYASGRG